jgi:hypothetical protein
MRLIEHPNVWAATIEGDTLAARTDLDLGTDCPEDDNRAYMLSRAAINEMRRKHFRLVRVLDRQPRRWLDANGCMP